eukprot:349957-Pelagomonas_calceolata.AAC.3
MDVFGHPISSEQGGRSRVALLGTCSAIYKRTRQKAQQQAASYLPSCGKIALHAMRLSGRSMWVGFAHDA